MPFFVQTLTHPGRSLTPAETTTIAAAFPGLDESYEMWNPGAEGTWFQELRAPPCRSERVFVVELRVWISAYLRYTQAQYERTVSTLLRNLKGDTPVYVRSVLKQLLGKSGEAGTAAQQKAVLLTMRVCHFR